MSFYSAAWPLVNTPLESFQIGLPSTWIVPDNVGYKGCLCPKGTIARDNWPERGPTYRDVFQTIEGGLGFWGSTQFASSAPKYRMNGTPDCYNTEISSPGWGFGRPDPLKGDEVGMAQLSNRLLVPPDGFTFKSGTRGELLGNAWMALPLTDYRGYFQLQTKAIEETDKCLEGNRPAPGSALHGASFMAPRGRDPASCGNSSPPRTAISACKRYSPRRTTYVWRGRRPTRTRSEWGRRSWRSRPTPTPSCGS